MQNTAFRDAIHGLLQDGRRPLDVQTAKQRKTRGRNRPSGRPPRSKKTEHNAMNKKVKNLARNDRTIKFAHNIDTPHNEYRQLDANSYTDNREVVSTRFVERAVSPAPRRRPVTFGKGPRRDYWACTFDIVSRFLRQVHGKHQYAELPYRSKRGAHAQNADRPDSGRALLHGHGACAGRGHTTLPQAAGRRAGRQAR